MIPDQREHLVQWPCLRLTGVVELQQQDNMRCSHTGQCGMRSMIINSLADDSRDTRFRRLESWR